MKWILIASLILITACEGALEVDAGGFDDMALEASAPAALSGPADSPLSDPAAAPTVEERDVVPDVADPQDDPLPADEMPAEDTMSEALPELGSIVEFSIEPGTGSGAWNSADDPVIVYVGQVLKIVNADDRNHQMHAASDAPVPHGDRLLPGQSEEYAVTSVLEISGSARAWDHGDGRSAAFWIEARPYPEP